jgi:hypothetical protein
MENIILSAVALSIIVSGIIVLGVAIRRDKRHDSHRIQKRQNQTRQG